MHGDGFGAVLIVGLPYAWGVASVVFAGLATTLMLQRPNKPLSTWINGLFVNVTLAFGWCSWLTTFLTRGFTADEIDRPQLWALLIAGNVVPWTVTLAGIGVAYYTYRTVPVETIDHRDERQAATQDVLDETSLVLAKRGKRLSDAGIDLDERILQLGEDRREADQREHDLDRRDRT